MANLKKLGDINRELSKSEVIKLANDNAQEVIDSKKYDLLKVYIELKRYEIYLKVIIGKIKLLALNQALVIGQNTFEYSHAKVNISTRTTWDFSSDKIWKELDDKINDLVLIKKNRELYLKQHNELIEIIDKQTDEIIDNTEIPKEINRGLTIRL